MIDISKIEDLTPFELARLNCEFFATNIVVCAGLQEAIRMDLECDAQRTAMADLIEASEGEDDDPVSADLIQAAAVIEETQLAAAAKIWTAVNMLDAIGINA